MPRVVEDWKCWKIESAGRLEVLEDWKCWKIGSVGKSEEMLKEILPIRISENICTSSINRLSVGIKTLF